MGGLVTGEDWVRAVTFAAQFRTRSFGNTLLIAAAHADAYQQGRVPEPLPTMVAGFWQWLQLGRHVVRGQAGYMIYAPVTARFASSTPGDAQSWRRLQRGERPGTGDAVTARMVGFRQAYVFDVSQTDGQPVPQRPRPVLLAGEAPAGLRDGLEQLLRDSGFAVATVADARVLGGANGMTDFGRRRVAVRGDIDDAAQVKTLVHELAHVVLGHETRRAEGLHRGIGEVEAESVALMVTAAWGMDSSRYSVGYVGHWSSRVQGRDPVEVVRATGELARVTALGILDKLPDPPCGDGAPPAPERHLDRPLTSTAASRADVAAARARPGRAPARPSLGL